MSGAAMPAARDSFSLGEKVVAPKAWPDEGLPRIRKFPTASASLAITALHAHPHPAALTRVHLLPEGEG